MSLFCTVIALLVMRGVSSLSSFDINRTLRNIPEDGHYNFTQMATKYGHPATVHHVITEDGYNLTLFNLPGNKTRSVLLKHGIFDSADGLILRGNKSLAIILADNGYDVWLLNQRGCRYSRKHKTLNPDKDAKFWDYSVHELGVYDNSANIDYVLNATNQSRISLIGFSEGTTMGYVLGATRPEYNDKIKVFIGLAPIAFLQNTVGPMRFWITLGTLLNDIIPKFVNEIAGFFSLSKVIINFLCTQLDIGYDFCFGGIINPLVGPNTDSIEESFFKVLIAHFPAGTSKKNLIHYSQIGTSGTFAAYDYGRARNLEVYNSSLPPIYDLKKVTMPVVLVSGRNDRVSTLADVQMLHDQLPNVREWKILEDPLYNHFDHLWARNAYEVEYPFILDTLAKYEG